MNILTVRQFIVTDSSKQREAQVLLLLAAFSRGQPVDKTKRRCP